jgi:hypothetical protein
VQDPLGRAGRQPEYLLGKSAHADYCLYRFRDKSSAYGLENRFAPADEVEIGLRDLIAHLKQEGKLIVARQVEADLIGFRRKADAEAEVEGAGKKRRVETMGAGKKKRAKEF